MRVLHADAELLAETHGVDRVALARGRAARAAARARPSRHASGDLLPLGLLGLLAAFSPFGRARPSRPSSSAPSTPGIDERLPELEVLGVLQVVGLEDGLHGHVVAVGDRLDRVAALDDVRHVGPAPGEAGGRASKTATAAATAKRRMAGLPYLKSGRAGRAAFFDGRRGGCHTATRCSGAPPRRRRVRPHGRRQEPRRRRHRRELHQGRAAQGDPQEAAGHQLGLRRAAAADDHRRPRHERGRRDRGAPHDLHRQQDPAARRRHRRLRPERHRPQDHRPDDDPRASSTSRSTGRPSSTSPSTSSSCRSTTRSCAAGPRPGRWICSSSPPRRTRSTTTPRILREAKLKPGRRRHQRLHHPEHLRAPVRPAAGRHDRAPQRGRRRLVAQHRGQGRQRVHARDHQRRQRHHRGDPQGARRARTSRPRPTRCGGGPTQIVPQEVTQIINQACQALAGEIQRSLDFYLATSGEQEIGRIYVSGGSAYLAPLVQAIEKRARVPVQLFDPMVNLAVDAKTVNEAELRARWPRRWWSRSGLSLRCDKERRQWSA